MAVDSKNGAPQNGANGASPSPSATLLGTSAPVRKRSSSLMKNVSTLPTVEHSLEEFIAKANQTLVDVSGWGEADAQAKQEDAQRKEQDAQRWKAAEQQMRESEAREASLRRQLDGLQGKLAEAEARAAVAMASSTGSFPAQSAAADGTINDLKTQIEKALQRMKAAEERSAELARELETTKRATAAHPAVPAPVATAVAIDDGEAAERIRIAEAKAAKALAAARAAQAGLTVSAADIAAIESGLVVAEPPAPKTSPVVPIALAFVGGLGIMFLVWKFALSKNDAPAPAPAAPAAVTQPAAAAAPTPTPTPAPTAAPAEPAAAPTVTPIDEAPKAAAPSVTPIDETPTPTEPAAVAPAAEPAAAPAVAEPAVEPKAEPVQAAPKKAATKKTTTKKAAPKKADLADPFATPSKKAAPKAEKKPAGGIVDPF